MTDDIAIRVSHLGKKYQLGGHREPYHTLRDAIVDSLKSPLRAFNRAPPDEVFWALRDVSFEVEKGEIVGVIGRNGAGKSTLLKILTRITTPTEGRVEIHGRVGSLLEIGTGFHPEMTGRENIFLNGSILGMKRTEIEQKFDEIIKFSEIEKFIDTPVKRYSSGMYVRLAFAVAAHLEPEILLIDEVLAVGDLAFQKKCLGKMGDVAKEGRTVLFVSHNMGAVQSLCSRAILIASGHVKFDGSAQEGISMYSLIDEQRSFVDFKNFRGGRRGDKKIAELIRMSVLNEQRKECNIFSMGDPMIIHLTVNLFSPMREPRIGVMLVNSLNSVLHDFTSSFDISIPCLDIGLHTFEIVVPRILVYPGIYTLGAWIQTRIGVASEDYVRAALTFTVIDSKLTGHPNACFDCISSDGTEVYVPCTWTELS
jgi:lipopolysaccharide transport system ATP-binding protein